MVFENKVSKLVEMVKEKKNDLTDLDLQLYRITVSMLSKGYSYSSFKKQLEINDDVTHPSLTPPS